MIWRYKKILYYAITDYGIYLTYTEVLLPTNESIILSCPLPSWGGRKEELTREVAPLPTRLHWN
jgi:hypothetical protein